MLHYALRNSEFIFLTSLHYTGPFLVLGYYVKFSNPTVLAGLRLYPVSYVIIQDLTLHIRQFLAKTLSIIPDQASCVS